MLAYNRARGGSYWLEFVAVRTVVCTLCVFACAYICYYSKVRLSNLVVTEVPYFTDIHGYPVDYITPTQAVWLVESTVSPRKFVCVCVCLSICVPPRRKHSSSSDNSLYRPDLV